MTAPNVLIIGGTGVFGKRLVRHLSSQRGLVLNVSSRSAVKATAFIKTLTSPQATLHPIALDSQVNLQEQLDQIRPSIVVDCSGPFQGAGYETAQAVLKAGAHFIDLADARDYLAGFGAALDVTARQNGVCALSGASSTPTLSTSVARHLTLGWQRVDTIDMAITPGGKSEVGRSVIEAILSYAGKDVPLWSNGRLTQTTGWRNAKRINLPGLGRRRVAAVETFDAEYVGPLLDVQSRVSFSAGLESGVEQRGIEAIAMLCKHKLIGSPIALIPVLLKARQITRIPTSSSGGMLVDICGLNADGVMTQATWSLVARQDHGPYIPILPAAAAIRKLLSCTVGAGAGFAHSALSLEDILQEMQAYDIKTATSVVQTDQSIFEKALGARAIKALPECLQQFHAPSGPVLWSGEADVERGAGILPQVIARLFGFPQTGQAVPVTVSIDRKQSSHGMPIEVWTRTFANKSMTSVLSHSGNGMIVERFAPFSFALRLAQDADGLRMPLAKWWLGKLPLPRVLAPRSDTREYVDEMGRFHFDVKLSVPIFGQLIHYRGWLAPDRKG
ncbi:DUF4166 domain-containing protein [uncultured Tateyamaria sp.]|uniref:DUF4166 domain-containing protein n=1 Tax=uncultured Tateyamaria sp. TaxID=455651 RepID=UPI002602F798|nr:DUF4166 domain-containing protein [uncultured Tateyamaria sp.]